ncbi:MAG: S1 RNA-binding domain-containing protein [Chloroflexi bacterium]|nr:S1 RNA-binding domain-containing protein [Chloroflexota bacterium]
MSEVVEETTVEETTPQKPQSINDLKPKMKISGIVTRLELYGAFIDIGIGTNALIHISKLGNEHVNRVADVLTEGEEVTVWVDKVDPKRNQIMVTMIEPLAVEWRDLEKGQVYTGTVTRLENFGSFINIGAEREGLVHISELSHDYVKHPSEALSVGDEVQVQVLGFSKRKRRIDLSVKALLEKPESETTVYEEFKEIDFEEEPEEEMLSAMEFALRQALGDDMPPSRSDSRRKKKSRGKKRHRNKYRDQQDDILDRTLHVS